MHTIIAKKDNIPEFRFDNKFGYVVGDQIQKVVFYNYMVVDIDGDHVTLRKVKEIEE